MDHARQKLKQIHTISTAHHATRPWITPIPCPLPRRRPRWTRTKRPVGNVLCRQRSRVWKAKRDEISTTTPVASVIHYQLVISACDHGTETRMWAPEAAAGHGHVGGRKRASVQPAPSARMVAAQHTAASTDSTCLGGGSGFLINGADAYGTRNL